ncbi:hypothetical protein Vadar_028443 [Vaccinium darrowii]|uniref:Uncharacterized protein n=1 Tax=Vaccinium darrowii TaxID=229202 RepID=A0ACB7YIS2_9ERIC|nr:hypothetical protein Vadar_028443 [Vaccinium darrowii]
MQAITIFLCAANGYDDTLFSIGKRAFRTPKARSITFRNLACASLWTAKKRANRTIVHKKLSDFRLLNRLNSGLMEISLINVLLNSISSFLYLSSHDNVTHEPALKYYRKAEEILKLLKPVLDAVFDSDVASEELLQKAFADLGDSVIELKELFGNLHPLTSKIYLVLQFETSILKVQASIVEIFKHLKSFAQHLPLELNASSLELCEQNIKQIGVEQTSTIISQAIREQVEGPGPSSESLAKLEDRLSLKSNEELLIEVVALEKFKEYAEQAEENSEAEYFNQMIALVTLMHEGLVAMEQFESSNPIPVPAEFCCPLSLKLMTDPNMDNRIVIANFGVIGLLVDLLHSTDAKIQENAVTAVLHLSINDNNKIAIANVNAIEHLFHVLYTGTPEAKENSAATLFSLSFIGENKVRIGSSGVIKPLVELLGNGTPRGRKYASTAVFSLSTFHENKSRIVQAGAVTYSMDPAGMVDKA